MMTVTKTTDGVEMIPKLEKIYDLLQFGAGEERSLLQKLMETIAKPEDLAASPFQIHNFVMNRKEFCTDWAQMKQAKIEIFHRLCDLNEMAYDYAKKHLEIRRLQRKFELLDKSEADPVIRIIERETINLEMQQEHFRMAMIRIQAHGRFLEATEFFSVYQKYSSLENLPASEIANLEETQWRTKSQYYPELRDRYNMTEEGRLLFPHEKGDPAMKFPRLRGGKKQ